MTEDSNGAPEETGSVTRAARMAGLLLALMVFATKNDIMRIFFGS